jgi:hypothetical protein
MTAANQARLDQLAPVRGRPGWLSYIVGDSELGWTVGPSRATPDGQYASSAEGLRSRVRDEKLRDRHPALRVALVGDSYTFGMDVPFDATWAAHLERLLGPDVQVLNFGVDGYGIDQAYLRYRRDVRPWQPDLVLFSFIQHDMRRTVAVYPFIAFGWEYPFAKPRFALESGQLRLLNVPLPDPRSLAALEDPASLPHAAYDLGYLRANWRFRRGEAPLVGRLLGALAERPGQHPPRVSFESSIELSAALLAAFQADAAEAGSRTRIIYLPTAGAGDFGGTASPEERIARTLLAQHSIAHLDLTACVSAVPANQRLVPGKTHYGAITNRAVAECVAADLRSMAANW